MTATDFRSGEQDRPLVSILMPAFNEGPLLAQSLSRVHAALCEATERYRGEIVVVDDGSRDDTWEIVSGFARSHRGVRPVRHPVNLGLGQALRTGFAHCAGDYVVVLDTDLSYGPDHIEKLVEILRATRAHVAVASPYMKGGKVTNVPAGRALLSREANRFLSFFCPQADVRTLTGMVRAYDGTFLRALNLRSLGVEINTEILYKTLLLRGRIVEVPAHLDWTLQRQTAKKRVSSFRVLQGIVTYLLAGFVFRPFMFFVLPGLVLGLVAVYIAVWTAQNVAQAYQWAPAGIYWDDRFSSATARVFQERPHAFFVGGVVALLALQMISLGFLSYQNKRYFEELFHLASGIRRRVIEPPPLATDTECCDGDAACVEAPGASARPAVGEHP
jgi:glycosyltransferase involved in cell wall biosynthesis